MLQTFATRHWQDPVTDSAKQQAMSSLESGQILFFPELAFQLSTLEQQFLSAEFADPHAKNISFQADKLWNVQHLNDKQHMDLRAMLDRYSRYAQSFIKLIFPQYADHLIVARTSFRPVQICDRVTSFRKDDKRLHVDAFPSAPNQGKRILRVFCNINPHGEDRIWRVGEPFTQVANRFLPKIKKPIPGSSTILRMLKITKSYRTLYDHYMLNIHDLMKANDHYQKQVDQQEIHFPPGSTWIVQTDHVSHAAMKGQHVLEQTFYLPVSVMQNEQHSPLRILENMLNQPLA